MVSETKARQFAKAFIKNDMNGTAAVREIEPKYRDISNKKVQAVAQVKAVRMLSSDKVKKSLAEIMDENGLDDDEIERLLKRNASQSKNIPASNQAIDMTIKVKGHYAPEKKAIVNLNLTGNIDEQINLLTSELETLKQLSAPK